MQINAPLRECMKHTSTFAARDFKNVSSADKMDERVFIDFSLFEVINNLMGIYTYFCKFIYDVFPILFFFKKIDFLLKFTF